MGEPTALVKAVRNSKTLWFGMFGSPAIWSVHFIVGYLLGEASCETNLLSGQLLGMNALRLILVVITLIAMAAIIWNGWWSYRSWRYYSALNPEEEHPLQAFDRDEFLSLAGLLLSGIFFLLLLMNLYPFLTLRLCV